jgi:hypothetical protein
VRRALRGWVQVAWGVVVGLDVHYGWYGLAAGMFTAGLLLHTEDRT